jgi:hypothetical protein
LGLADGRTARPLKRMKMAAPTTAAGPTFAELFTPKLVTVLREGYGLRH